jgi:hypothetical protein
LACHHTEQTHTEDYYQQVVVENIWIWESEEKVGENWITRGLTVCIFRQILLGQSNRRCTKYSDDTDISQIRDNMWDNNEIYDNTWDNTGPLKVPTSRETQQTSITNTNRLLYITAADCANLATDRYIMLNKRQNYCTMKRV